MGKEINRIGIGIAECKYCDRLKKENEELREKTNTINALGYIWSQCALEVIPAKTYVQINKIFEEKLKILLKEIENVR